MQPVCCGYDHVTIAHLRYIIDAAHIICALLVQFSVKDHDATIVAAAPKLLVDDTSSLDVAVDLFHY